jgi:outer membrane protein assembly factor BamE (lipoprotein component of BamABCDE complex)
MSACLEAGNPAWHTGLRAGTALAVLVCLALVPAGCSSLRISETLSKVGEPGSPPAGEALEQVTEGETTRDELVALLGPPTSVAGAQDGAEELVYRFLVRRTEEHTVIPVTKSTRVTHMMLVVTFRVADGIVTDGQQAYHPLAEPAPHDG